MKPEAYTNAEEAYTVAAACGNNARLIQVDRALCPNLKPGEVGYLVAANATSLFDAAGKVWHVRVRCHRAEKGEPGTPEFRPGKFELFLEQGEEAL